MTTGHMATNDPMTTSTDWLAGLWAGLIAGVAFMMLEMGLVWLVQAMSPWGPPHMIAAMVLGKDVLPAPGTWAPFNVTIMVTAMVIHMMLSAALGVLGARLLRGSGTGRAAGLGAVFGLAIYVVNFYLIAPFIFPWFEMGRNWIGAFSHLMFGVVLGLAYVAFRKNKVT